MSDLNNDHNVYILGAGFSADRGLPLISNFMDAMRDAREWLAEKGRGQEADAISKVLDFRLTAASAAYRVKIDLDNIEELFSLAATSDLTLSKAIQMAIAATLDFRSSVTPDPIVRLRIEQNNSDAPDYSDWAGWRHYDPLNNFVEAPLYSFYVNAMIGGLAGGPRKGRNTFITFNYDCLVEDALQSLGVRYTYGFKPKSVSYDDECRGLDLYDPKAIKVLKLHGSVNWALPGKRGRKLTVFRSYADVMGKNLYPELIAPTWRKVFDGQLNNIWDNAITELATASRVIVIGFSMPPTDMHFKYLLAAGLKKNISLREIVFVDPARQRIEERSASVFGEMMRESRKLTYTSSDTRGFVNQGSGGSESRYVGDMGRGIHSAIQRY